MVEEDDGPADLAEVSTVMGSRTSWTCTAPASAIACEVLGDGGGVAVDRDTVAL